ncbi:MAG: DNA repair protein RecN [Gammaproteobacteria bacterium]|nr:DNA repair protein RecN [Gammaproteobacteria bacterium]
MLSHLAIRDFAIIDAIDVELEPGLSVLTGETGAGKSILVGALGLALGDRAEASVVRHGAQRAEISASFDIPDLGEVADWLKKRDLDADGECNLRRVISADGRSRAYVNGQPLPLQSLRRLSSLLVDIHGQHEHQSLLRGPAQRRLVDHHAAHGGLLDRLGAAFDRWQTLKTELEGIADDTRERDAQLDLLRYQIGELEALRLAPGEAEMLIAEYRRLANASELAAAAQVALELVYENEEHAAQHMLGRALSALQRVQESDPRLAESCKLIGEAEIGANEAAESLRRYLDGLEADPGRLGEVERRLADLHTLARKHRTGIETLGERLEVLRDQLQRLTGDELRRDGLAAECEDALSAYRELARDVSRSRDAACRELNRLVTRSIRELGMPGGQFEAAIQAAPVATAHGLDHVEFQVSINPGQPLRPLAKVASGGELSRISLALQVIAAEAAAVPCMVFDEVDAGIGGGTAEIVGRRLRELGRRRQVLCVTHLPQVASQGQHHFRTSKLSAHGDIRTLLTALDQEARVEELSRMLGGVEITQRTRAHAQEMIEQAQGDWPAQ